MDDKEIVENVFQDHGFRVPLNLKVECRGPDLPYHMTGKRRFLGVTLNEVGGFDPGVTRLYFSVSRGQFVQGVDLFVGKNDRQSGVGSSLVYFMGRVGRGFNCEGIRFNVIKAPTSKDEKIALAFWNEMGFQYDPETKHWQRSCAGFY